MRKNLINFFSNLLVMKQNCFIGSVLCFILVSQFYFYNVQGRIIDFFQNESQITKVHVIFMNHLDIGFNHGEHPPQENGEPGLPCLVPPYPPECGFSYSVINVYFDWFFPQGLFFE